MSAFVVDASVGIKWFIPEIHSDAAQRLQDPTHDLHVPTIFDAEIANTLWKKIQRGELTRAEADDILQRLSLLPIMRHPDATFLLAAFDLAVHTGRTVYDCLYLALAVQLNCRMATADERLVNSLAATKWAPQTIRIQDIS